MLPLALALALSSCGGGSGSTPPAVTSPAVNLSTTTGVAPLSVFFDATGTTSPATNKPFHDLRYTWDFGDGAHNAPWNYGSHSGETCNSTSNVPGCRNYASGGVAAHVYETPGTYHPTLTVYDGTRSYPGPSVTVTVTDPNVQFEPPLGTTYCIGAATTPVAGSDGCPAGSTGVMNAAFDSVINTYAAPHVRLLLKHDDTFTLNNPATLKSAGPGMIGMYGSGAKPAITTNLAGVSHSSVTAIVLSAFSIPTPYPSDWRIVDLDIASSAQYTTLFSTDGGFDDLLFLRDNLHDACGMLTMADSILEYDGGIPAGQHEFQNIAVVDSIFQHVNSGGGCVGLYGGFDHLALLGDWFDDSLNAEFPVRLQHVRWGTVSNNTFSKAPAIKSVLTIRAPEYEINGGNGSFPLTLPGDAALTRYVEVSDNHLMGQLPVELEQDGPQNTASDDRLEDFVYERNWYTTTQDPGGQGQQIALTLHMKGVTVRNNIFDLSGAYIGNGVVFQGAAAAPASDDIRVYNNTFYSGGNIYSPTTFHAISIGAAMTTSVYNNLAYAPHNVIRDLINGGVAFTYGGNNSTDADIHGSDPLFATYPPSSPADFKPQTGSYAIVAGYSTPPPLWRDFFGTTRTSPYDMGAVNH